MAGEGWEYRTLSPDGKESHLRRWFFLTLSGLPGLYREGYFKPELWDLLMRELWRRAFVDGKSLDSNRAIRLQFCMKG
jgi:hypothetical protein